MPGVLTSFHYYGTTDLDDLFGDLTPPLFADSGAFSAATQGAEIDIDEYSAWLHHWEHRITVCCNLDVIYDPVQSQINLDRLEADGHRPLPVFHGGTDFAVLDEMADRYDYICLGGIARHGARKTALRRWLDHAFEVVHGRARLHGLGVTSWWALTRYPWRSVDSTSWTAAYRFGQVALFDPDRPHLGFLPMKMGTDDVQRYARLLRLYGADPVVFMDRARYDRRDACRLSAAVWGEIERHLRGARVYLGCTERVETELLTAYLGGGGSRWEMNTLTAYLGDGSPEHLAIAAEVNQGEHT